MSSMTASKKPEHHPEDFGLDVTRGDDDVFRWFLLVYLLGKPIQSGVAVQTWRLFVERGLDTPWTIVDTSDHALSRLFVEGKYTRYNHVMTAALKRCMQQLIQMYDGSLTLLIDSSADQDECARRLREFHGVGPKTAEIFMRDIDELFARRVE